MKLYQLDQDKILEYKLIKSFKEEAEYKRQVINKTDQLFYEFQTSDQELVDKLKKGEDIDQGYYKEPTNEKYFSITPYYYPNKQTEGIVTNYINDFYSKPICVKLENIRPKHQERDYFLLTQKETIKGDYTTFPYVWKMPIELASLTLLEQGNFKRLIEDDNLVDYLPTELYKIYPIGEYDGKFLSSEIPGIMNISKEIESQTKIIQKIKAK